MNRRLSLLPLAAVLLCASSAQAQDSDQDGTLDAADLYPCDPRAVGEAFAPGQGQHGLLEFEDEWPLASDLDFDDVVLSYNYAVKVDANGDAVSMRATYNVLALGGYFDHGFALQLPVLASQVASVTRTVGAGTPASVAPRSLDANLTFDVVADLRSLFSGQSLQINSQPGQPTLTAAPVLIEIIFAQPVALSIVQAPFDGFIFRVNARGHEIHRTGYAGSAAMNTSLFGSGVDASGPGRNFVDGSGLPYALNLPEVAPYAQEGVQISALFPDILGFAASAGTTNADFFKTNVNMSQAYANPVAPTFTGLAPLADRSCVPVFSANGGTVTEINGGRHTVHTFTANGTFDASGASQNVEILMVGGGGGGGGRHGGGGGGGGVLSGSLNLSAQTYNISIGAGGTAIVGTGIAGSNGQSTTAFGATAIGGGGGGAYAGVHGRSGGSGGGGGHSSTNGGAATQTDSGGLTGYGNPGANNPTGGNEASGGGGAGANDAVSGAAESTGGRGGSGFQSNIDGNDYYYGGGGGGGGWGNDGGQGGIGGGGGGNTANGGAPGTGGGSARNAGQDGQGAVSPATYYGGNGGANTGGGGGGSGQGSYQGWNSYGGAGGSGIVIVRYPTPGFPIISFASPAVGVVSGRSATLNWTVTDASACVASGDWSGPKQLIGSQSTAALTSASTFTLTCTGTRGTTVRTVSVGIGRAFGGQVTRVGNYVVHTFSADGVFDIIAPELDVEVLLVGGGGGGGGRHGGGGGGGGVLEGNLSLAGNNNYSVVVGAGGTAIIGTGIAGNNGQASTAFGATAIGGGGGGAYAGVHGRSGGSGGGGGHSSTNGGATTQTDSIGLTGYGNPGANNPSGGNEASGGGGAGANDAVAGAGNSTGGRGGAGIQSNIDGNNYYYAGGGGGGGWQNNGGHGGIGGGGGGNTAAGGTPGTGGGSAQNPGQDGLGTGGPATYFGGDAGANTGGGGGGSGQADYQGWYSYGGAGGSGIVIVRYLDPGLPLMSFSRTGSGTLIGESVTVSWDVVDASACTATGDWSGPQVMAGSFATGPLSSDQTYTLTCTNSNGSRSMTVDVGVANSGVGGTVSDVGPYRVHTFTADQTFEALQPNLDVEVLMVGGGGGGGGRHGGGGGGGGVLTGNIILNAQVYALTIGAGGTPVAGTGVAGNNGSPSTGFGATALGGGGGGAYSGTPGRNGGSGGGGGHSATNGGAALQAGSGGLTGYGNAGANNPSGGNEASGGGGAGANDAVPGAAESTGGRGGSGLQSNIDGNNYYYAGGGGGGGWQNNGGNGGIGGGGGGNTAAGGTPGTGGGSARNAGQAGQGSVSAAAYYGGDGGANTGGGGGGSGQASYGGWTSYGGAGGSGIIIVRYLR